MQNKNTFYILGALVVGFGFGYLVFSNKTVMVHDMNTTMDGMTLNLENKKEDAFDRAFIEEMIVHHEGAVTMAQMALQSAKRVEIKTMAKDIISAQTAEIIQMKGWLKDWYGADASDAIHRAQ